MNTLVILALSTYHILAVVLVVLLLFGGKKIPEFMRGLGSGIKEFKDAVKDEDKKGNTDASSNSKDSSSNSNNSAN